MTAAILSTNNPPEYLFWPNYFAGFMGSKGFYRVITTVEPRPHIIEYTNRLRLINGCSNTSITVSATFGVDWSRDEYGPVLLSPGNTSEWDFAYFLEASDDLDGPHIMDWSTTVQGTWIASQQTNTFVTHVMGLLRPITAIRIHDVGHTEQFPRE